MSETASIPKIRSAITDEIFFALGLHRRGVMRRALGWLFTLPASIFARLMAEMDRAVAEGGPPAGCKVMLDQLGVQVQALGSANIPLQGPVIILANHPGAYDSMAIGGQLPRVDLKVIAGETRLYQVLPNIHPRILSVSSEKGQRMLTLIGAVEHLKTGGSLLQFGSGLIEPDPATQPIDDAVFDKWSPSLEILLRKVPDIQVVPTIASGVLLDRFLTHPLTKLRQDAMDRRRLAEFRQVIQQLLFPKSVEANPQVSFGKPFKLVDIEAEAVNGRLMPVVIEHMKQQLADHLSWIKRMKLTVEQVSN